MIKITCALDVYQNGCFPNDLKHVPHKGDMIRVLKSYQSLFLEKRFPIQLEVKSVTHTEDGIIVSVWLSQLQAEIIKQNKIPIFG